MQNQTSFDNTIPTQENNQASNENNNIPISYEPNTIQNQTLSDNNIPNQTSFDINQAQPSQKSFNTGSSSETSFIGPDILKQQLECMQLSDIAEENENVGACPINKLTPSTSDLEEIHQNTDDLKNDASTQQPQSDFQAYCQRRFSELMKSHPQLCENKDQITLLLAEEWQNLKATQLTVPDNFDMQVTSQVDQVNKGTPIKQPKPAWSPQDGKPPKRALTPYMIFVKERKADIMAENPSLTFGQMMQLVAERWRQIPQDDREYFQQQSDNDKIRLNEQTEMWTHFLRSNPLGKKQSKKVKQNLYKHGLAYQVPQKVQIIRPQAVVQPPPAVRSNLNLTQNQNPAFLMQMVQQQQSYIQILQTQKTLLQNECDSLKVQLEQTLQSSQMGAPIQLNLGQPHHFTQAHQLGQVNQMKQVNKPSSGFEVFCKQVSKEILRRNPLAGQNPQEIKQIVEKEWLLLPEEKRRIYDRVATQSFS